MIDARHMWAALGIARRGLGTTWPNPSVGCVVVKDGVVVARGATAKGGRPHAETEALARAGRDARGSTVYVTLEPCAHHGNTAPCADALLAAKVGRVVVAVEDPDSRTKGQGIARLRDAGLEVQVGLLAREAEELNAGFFSLMKSGRPLVTLKLATSLDGKIAAHTGESQWITGEAARARAHLLRATHDAVVVGSGTVLTDDPELTCRLPGMLERSPVRVVVDGLLRVPLTARVVSGAKRVPTWFITRHGADKDRRHAFEECGVELIEVAAGDGGETDLGAALAVLGKKGVTRLLVEGGATLGAALLRADLVDRIEWFRAPSLIGGDGVASVAALGVTSPGEARRFKPVACEPFGEDVLESFTRAV